MKIKFFAFMVILLLITSVAFAAPSDDKWELLQQIDSYSIFVDKESVFAEEDGTIFFWLKYLSSDKEVLQRYQTELVDYMRRQGKDTAAVQDKIYCVYQVHADLDNNRYAILYHYWYNASDDSFIVGYVNNNGWMRLEPSSAIYQSFQSVRSKAVNNSK